MPGYDRTGPQGAGPRTGRGWGLCGVPADGITSAEEPYRAYGLGRGGRPWGGGRGFGRGGRGRRRGFGRGMWAMADPAGPGAVARQQQTFLMRQMEALTTAVDRLREILSKSPPAEGQDRE